MPSGVSGSKIIGGGTTHNAVNYLWNQITWLWVDFKQDVGSVTYLDGVPNKLELRYRVPLYMLILASVTDVMDVIWDCINFSQLR
jgi:hypothetical protein